jgi:hypothetical protein
MATHHVVTTEAGAVTAVAVCTEAPTTVITSSTIHIRTILAPAKKSIVGLHPTWSTTRTTKCVALALGSPAWIGYLDRVRPVVALPNPIRIHQCAVMVC